MTTVTLVQIAGRKLAMAFVSAFRTNESVGPAEFDQGLPALCPGSVLSKKIAQTQSFLKLHFVFRHDTSSMLSKGYIFIVPCKLCLFKWVIRYKYSLLGKINPMLNIASSIKIVFLQDV